MGGSSRSWRRRVGIANATIAIVIVIAVAILVAIVIVIVDNIMVTIVVVIVIAIVATIVIVIGVVVRVIVIVVVRVIVIGPPFCEAFSRHHNARAGVGVRCGVNDGRDDVGAGGVGSEG